MHNHERGRLSAVETALVIVLMCEVAPRAAAFAPSSRVLSSRGVVARLRATSPLQAQCSTAEPPLSRRRAIGVVLAAAPAVGVAVLTPADAHAELDADDKKILAGYKTVM